MLLRVEELSAHATAHEQPIQLLHDISFSMEEGEILVLVGESGSGKTTLARALTNLFLRGHNISVHGNVQFEGSNLLASEPHAIRKVRARGIRYVFQEPGSAFNPGFRLRSQLRLLSFPHPDSEKHSKKASDEAIRGSLKAMGIAEPQDVLSSYPHQLSVGTLQRIFIAAAIAPRPRLLIADEPTSAVDAVLRFEILDLLQGYCRTHMMALLLITHDLQIARRYGDRIAVLYAGRIVEISEKAEFFVKALHPYSEMLVRGAPDTLASLDGMPTIPGSIPSIADLPGGCKFHPRCYKAQIDCREQEPELVSTHENRRVRCPYWK